MMEMADGFVQYGSFLRPLATLPPMDLQSSTQCASAKTAAKVKGKGKGKKRKLESSASTSHARQAPTRTEMKFRVGVGSSFLKMFVGNVSTDLFLPRGYILEPDCLAKHWFTIYGPSGAAYKVWIESYLDSLVFRSGWSDVMEKECISQGDVGLFKRCDELEFSLTIYGRGGLEKEPGPLDAVVTSKTEPPKWEDVRFIATTGLRHTAALVSTLFSVWVQATHPIILYATTIKHYSLTGSPMSLNRSISARLPAGLEPIGLKFNGSRIVYPCVFVKRGDQMTRIQGGWNDFAKEHKLVVGCVYVFKFAIGCNGWEATVYEV